MLQICRLAEVRDQLMPIIDEIKKTRNFDKKLQYTIGDTENNEQLSVLLREDNHRNQITAVILFEQINLEIKSTKIMLDFQIEMKLGDSNHISIYDLELLLLPHEFLQEHEEIEIAKEVITCWNTDFISTS